MYKRQQVECAGARIARHHIDDAHLDIFGCGLAIHRIHQQAADAHTACSGIDAQRFEHHGRLTLEIAHKTQCIPECVVAVRS